MNPLHVAAQEGKREILFYLLKIFSEETDGTIKKNRKITIDIDLVDIEGNTCLHLAARRCQIDADAVSMVKMLIEKGGFKNIINLSKHIHSENLAFLMNLKKRIIKSLYDQFFF